MLKLPKTFKLTLLALSLLQLFTFANSSIVELMGINGVLYANGTPVGGDFINMWTVARLVFAGNFAPIYLPEAYVAFQHAAIVDADIGIRLWAYPPQSLLIAAPLGLLPNYYAALAAWSAAGLLMLGFGARRFGFDWIETAIIVTSPAACTCIYFGQTGNFGAGLLLVAMAPRGRFSPLAMAAAALLTFKPQIGYLLPLLYARQRRWWLIAGTGVLSVLLVGVTILIFGPQAWRDYVGASLPYLELAHRKGTGPGMLMVPSAFMSFRIWFGDDVLAGRLHLVFAALVGAFLLWRLFRTRDATAQAALMLIGTVLITPYMLNYDLAVLLAGALLVARIHAQSLVVYLLVVIAWSLPTTMILLNGIGAPISPLLILPLLVLAGRKPRPVAKGAPAALATAAAG
jgi:hypothetical protein